MTAENVAVSGSPLFKSILERAGDVVLADDLGELLRTVFTGQYLITHDEDVRKKRAKPDGIIRDAECD
jgi:ABC-type ATPase with predicted acetyltransferase domain